MYIPFCNLNDLFFYQSARHPIYIFNFIYYFPFVFIISSMFLGLGFCLFGGGVFLFAQELCEVKEMLTQTWYFPTCSPSPSSPPPLLWFFFLSFFRQQFGIFLGWDAAGGRRGWLFSICSFCANARSFCQSTKKMLHLLVALKRKKKIK